MHPCSLADSPPVTGRRLEAADMAATTADLTKIPIIASPASHFLPGSSPGTAGPTYPATASLQMQPGMDQAAWDGPGTAVLAQQAPHEAATSSLAAMAELPAGQPPSLSETAQTRAGVPGQGVAGSKAAMLLGVSHVQDQVAVLEHKIEETGGQVPSPSKQPGGPRFL